MMIVRRSPKALAADLGALKAASAQRINDAVGLARFANLTQAPGQDRIYGRKAAEGRAYLRRKTPPRGLGDFPLLAAELGLTDAEPADLARTWASKADAQDRLEEALEPIRRGALQALDGATTAAEMAEVEDLLAKSIAALA